MIEDRNRGLTIDDLLKLKRAERPSPEFWQGFERQLREKQLAAIVEKRPWWCAAPRLYAFMVRRRLPLAALSSSLALALIGFNAYQSFLPAAPVAAGFRPALASQPEAPAAAVAVESAPAVVPSPSVGEAPRAARSAAVAAVASAALPAIPLLDDLPSSNATERFGSLSRGLASDLTTVEGTGSASDRTFGNARDFGPRLLPAHALIAEPLAQMQAPSDEHRSRLLAEVYPAMAGPDDVVAPSSERVLSRLSDDRLYSSGGRYDLGSGHDSIKFSIRF